MKMCLTIPISLRHNVRKCREVVKVKTCVCGGGGTLTNRLLREGSKLERCPGRFMILLVIEY